MTTRIESEVPWLDFIAADWTRSRIRNVAILSPGLSGSIPNKDEPCVFVPMERLSDNNSIDYDVQVPYEDISPGLTAFEIGDIVFAKITPCMENGKGAYVADLPTRYAFGSTEYHVLRPGPWVDGRFLYYFTFNPAYRLYAAENMVGAAGQKRVSARFLKDTRLYLPPLPEQQRIAAYLDACCRAIDAAVVAKRKQIVILDRIRKATLQRVITRGLDASTELVPVKNEWLPRVPKGWRLPMLKRVASIQGGLTLGKIYEGTLIERPYLRVANVQDGHFNLDDITVIEVPASVAEGVTLRVGDVLMTEGGDLDKLGRGHVWNGEIADCLHQNHIFAVRCIEWKLRPKFLAYVTASQFGRDYFEATGKRTTNLAATNSTKVGQLPVPLPPLHVQDQIIAHLDDMTEMFNSLRDGLEEQIATLIAYRKSLIHECVSGQRRISESELAREQAHA